jgi:hypothetical protein
VVEAFTDGVKSGGRAGKCAAKTTASEEE